VKQTSLCQIIGAGPAGLSLIIAFYNRLADAHATQRLRIQELIDSLVMLDAAGSAGGLMSHYQINANTDAADVVSGIKDDTPFTNLRDHYLKLPETQQALIPLPKVGELMLQALVQKVSNLLGERLRLNSRVARVVKNDNQFVSLDANNQPLASSEYLVLCCGGSEVIMPELGELEGKTQFSGEFLLRRNVEDLPQRSGDIVIVGSSHSAFSCAWRLLHDSSMMEYARGRNIYILQRSKLVKLRCTLEFAQRHNLTYDPANDVCATSGLVYRNAGLRKDAKALYLQIRSGAEKRVQIVPISELSDQAALLDRAALIVQCTGFHTAWPEIEIDGKLSRIDQHSSHGELRDVDSATIIPGLYACGLGMQIKPESKYGGEKSFNGSINGLQSYPLVIAPQIIDQIIIDQIMETV
jgi:hypothetical protein